MREPAMKSAPLRENLPNLSSITVAGILLLLISYIVFQIFYAGDSISLLFYSISFVTFAYLLTASLWAYADPGKSLMSKVKTTPPISEQKEVLSQIVEKTCKIVGIPTPQVSFVEGDLNFLSVGSSQADAALLISENALSIMSEKELRAILAHEAFHIKTDIRYVSSMALYDRIVHLPMLIALPWLVVDFFLNLVTGQYRYYGNEYAAISLDAIIVLLIACDIVCFAAIKASSLFHKSAGVVCMTTLFSFVLFLLSPILILFHILLLVILIALIFVIFACSHCLLRLFFIEYGWLSYNEREFYADAMTSLTTLDTDSLKSALLKLAKHSLLSEFKKKDLLALCFYDPRSQSFAPEELKAKFQVDIRRHWKGFHHPSLTSRIYMLDLLRNLLNGEIVFSIKEDARKLKKATPLKITRMWPVISLSFFRRNFRTIDREKFQAILAYVLSNSSGLNLLKGRRELRNQGIAVSIVDIFTVFISLFTAGKIDLEQGS
jgi:Zn-dependent protease with chaperone function